jgi:PAS domain S-box-containing protein
MPEARAHPADSLDVGSAIEALLPAMLEALGVDQGTVQLHDAQAGTLRVVAQRGLDHGFLDRFGTTAVGTSPWGRAFQRGGTVVEDVTGQPQDADAAALAARGVAVLQSHLIGGPAGEATGLFTIYRAQAHRPDEGEVRLFRLFARHLEQVVASRGHEHALRLSEASQRFTQDAGKMGSWEWDLPAGAIRWSDNLEQIHGLAPGTFGRTFEAYQALVHPEDRDRFLDAVRACLEGRGDYEAEFRTVGSEGSIHWLLAKGRVVRGDKGEPARMIGVCRDVTARKNAEQALLEANQRKDEFLAMVSHELRNPLAAIMSSASLLDVSAGGAASMKARETIQHQTERLVRIVDDLLDVSRLTAGKLTLERKPLDFGALVERCVQDVVAHRLLDRHAYEVRCASAPVHGDGPRLEQVVTNLLTNAIKYTPPGGRISVQVEADGPDAVLRVSDSGIGIAPELLARIFDLFMQSERGLDRREGGLGLGLAIVRHLVKAHGGHVEAHSAGPGTGTELVVRLPLAASLAARGGAPPAPAGATARQRILIIDDNVDAREAVAALLKIAGHDVYQAGDGAGGLDWAARVTPDVAIIDIGLPGFDGFEVARRLRALSPSPRLIALTGYGQADHRRLGRSVGFEAYLVKPVGLEVLLRTLALTER